MNPRRRILELLVLGICAFVVTKAILAQVIDPGDAAPTEGSATFQLILGLSYLGVAWILVPYYRETLYVLGRNPFLVALVLLALVSSSWAATPALALRRAVAVLGTTLLGVALAVLLSIEEQLRFLSWFCRAIAVLSVAWVIFLPSYGISPTPDHQWQGVFVHKNALGFVMALSVLVELHLPIPTTSSRTLNRLALLLSAVLLFFSGSLSPTLALLSSLLMVNAYKFGVQRLRLSRTITVLALLLIMSSGTAMFFANSESITTALGRSSDLTGRTEIWSGVVPSILERPLLGYGYSGFWSEVSESAEINRKLGGMLAYSHNGYLEVLLGLGILGLALTLAFLGTGIRRTLYLSECDRSKIGFWPFTFLVFFVFQNFAECTIFSQDVLWAICVAMVASTDRALLTADEVEEEEGLLLESTGELT